MINIPPMAQKQAIQIRQFAGANFNIDTTQIGQTESPDMVNLAIDNDGTLEKRTGYKVVTRFQGRVNCIIAYEDGLVVAAGTRLYTYKDGVATEIYEGLTDAPAVAFVYADVLYLMNGHEYMLYDGTSVLPVPPYIPLLVISSPPAGGGYQFEEWNLLGTGFKQTFNTDGEAKDFHLAVNDLDADEVKAKNILTGAVYVEGVDFAVARETGVVTFTNAPQKVGDGVNELEIVAHRTYEGLADRITMCTKYHLYGGNNDTRVHFYGNPAFPSRIFRSGLSDPAYWPENNFNEPGMSSDAVISRITQYDTAVIFKTNSIYLETFTIDNNGNPMFPTRTLNAKIGCIAPDSVQLVENMPVFLSTNGVYSLASSSVRDERNVELVSEKINRELLKLDLAKAKSVIFDDQYFLFFPNGTVWVFHQRLSCWYPWEGIAASAVIKYGERLYFGRSDGALAYMKNTYDLKPYNDDEGIVPATGTFGEVMQTGAGLTWDNISAAVIDDEADCIITQNELEEVPDVVISGGYLQLDETTIPFADVPVAFPDALGTIAIGLGTVSLSELTTGDVKASVAVQIGEAACALVTPSHFAVTLPDGAKNLVLTLLVDCYRHVEEVTVPVNPEEPEGETVTTYDVTTAIRYIRLGITYELNLAIPCRWVSKVFVLGETMLSATKKFVAVFRPDISIVTSLDYRTDRRGSWEPAAKKDIGASLFDYRFTDYYRMTYLSNTMPQTVAKKFKTKRIGYLQLRLTNNLLDSSMGILLLSVTYLTEKER